MLFNELTIEEKMDRWEKHLSGFGLKALDSWNKSNRGYVNDMTQYLFSIYCVAMYDKEV